MFGWVMRTTLVTSIILAGMSISGSAWAQSEDAVAVLYNGGVSSVEVFDLTVAEPREAVRLGDRRVVPAALGAVRIADIKVLPDGSHLLADVDGRGAVVTSADGSEIRWELDPLQRLVDMDCASVGSYFAAGEPSLVVSGDSASSNVTVRSTSQNATVWFDTVRLTTSRGFVPQVAVLPNNEVAIAVNWPDAGIYGIRIRDTSGPVGSGREILNSTHAEARADAVIVPQLDSIRDLMVLEDGRMLVTLRFAMLILGADGRFDSLIDIGSLPEVSGELASVRVLSGGLWAIASFQPGQWIQPHVNHRVHWYDPASGTVVASSEPLRRAPLRVEAQAGTGGTNTVGFDGGLDLIQQGDPTAIELVSLVIGSASRIGTTLNARGTIRNAGPLPVGLASLAIRATPGTCVPNPQPVAELALAMSVAVNAGQQFALVGETFLDASYALGDWCAFVQGRDQQGVLRNYGEPVGFEIIESTSGNGSIIDVRPLPFNTGPDGDMGGDAGDGGDVGVDPPPDKGCCATVGSKSDTPFPGLFALLSALLWGRGRARR